MPERDPYIERIAVTWSDGTKLFLFLSALAVLMCWPWVKGAVL